MDMTYKTAPALPFASRLILAFLCFCAGFAIHVSSLPGILRWPLGWAIMLFGGLLSAAKDFSNKPADLGREEWRAVSVSETDRIADNLRRSKTLKPPFLLSKNASGLAITLSIVAIVLGLMFDDSKLLALLGADALAFLGPILSSGTVSVWIPTELKQKMECFQPILSAAAQQGIVMTPYLRFDKDKEGRDIPEDLRVMVEPRRKPNDFVGIQFQVTFNNGPNGKVPYMYAVCITRGGGPTFHRVSQLSAAGFVVEHKQPGEYGSVVIRQETYADGYETKPDDIRRLWGVCSQVLAQLSA